MIPLTSTSTYVSPKKEERSSDQCTLRQVGVLYRWLNSIYGQLRLISYEIEIPHSSLHTLSPSPPPPPHHITVNVWSYISWAGKGVLSVSNGPVVPTAPPVAPKPLSTTFCRDGGLSCWFSCLDGKASLLLRPSPLFSISMCVWWRIARG